MAISIAEIRKAENKEWDSMWAGTPYATYFHSRKWAELFCVYTDGKMHPAPLLVVFSDGCSALLPLTVEDVARKLTKRYYSSPAGTYGGWISIDPLTAEHAYLLTTLLLKKTGNLTWRLNPFDKLAANSVPDNRIDDETHALNLTHGFNKVFRGWTKGHKAAVKQALKAGITVRQANTIGDFEAYYTIYEDSLRRWGNNATSKYEWTFFKELYNKQSNSEVLWLADLDNTPVSGALCFYSGQIVTYWHGAALERYFNMRPVNLVMHEVIKHACQESYSWFDFNPSGGHEGVRAFKRSFGAEPMSCPVVMIRNPRMILIETLRKLLSR